MMIYKEVKPAERLQNFIHSYWRFEVDAEVYDKPFQHTIMADGCISLAFASIPGRADLSPVFSGATTKNLKVEVYPGATYTGIRFLPLAVYDLFGLTGIELRNKTISAGPYTKKLGIQLSAEAIDDDIGLYKLFDKVFSRYVDANPIEQHHSVLQAARKIIDKNGDVRISDIVAGSVMSERHLQRQFKKLAGLTLKEFARIRRIRAAVIQIMLEEQDAPDVIYNTGYYDRPHFNNEFSLIVGVSPSDFQKYIDHIEHIDVDPT